MKKKEPPKENLSELDWKIKLENYCAYRERCEQEVCRKMYDWQIPEADRDDLIAYLKEEGFLNEDRFVAAFARGKFRIKHWGRNKIQAELRARQIKDPKIRQSMAQIDEGEYFISLLELLEKKEKLLKEPDAFKKKQKLFLYAMQKGYESDLVREALASLKI
jgi:regulatory protein